MYMMGLNLFRFDLSETLYLATSETTLRLTNILVAKRTHHLCDRGLTQTVDYHPFSHCHPNNVKTMVSYYLIMEIDSRFSSHLATSGKI